MTSSQMSISQPVLRLSLLHRRLGGRAESLLSAMGYRGRFQAPSAAGCRKAIQRHGIFTRESDGVCRSSAVGGRTGGKLRTAAALMSQSARTARTKRGRESDPKRCSRVLDHHRRRSRSLSTDGLTKYFSADASDWASINRNRRVKRRGLTTRALLEMAPRPRQRMRIRAFPPDFAGNEGVGLIVDQRNRAPIGLSKLGSKTKLTPLRKWPEIDVDVALKAGDQAALTQSCRWFRRNQLGVRVPFTFWGAQTHPGPVVAAFRFSSRPSGRRQLRHILIVDR
jgi:hypothetical protein